MRNQIGRWLVLAAAVGLGSAGAHVADAAPAVHQTSDVTEFVSLADVGSASLNRTPKGVRMNIETAVGGELEDFGTTLGVDWETGDATTVWFVVFNDPGGCVDGCGEDDVLDFFFGANRAKVGVHFGTGHVAGDPTFSAAARLAEGDTKGMLFGMPLMDSQAAEIHLVVRSHGPAGALTGQQLAAALHSVDGGCAPDNGPNTCGDSQFAVFLAP